MAEPTPLPRRSSEGAFPVLDDSFVESANSFAKAEAQVAPEAKPADFPVVRLMQEILPQKNSHSMEVAYPGLYRLIRSNGKYLLDRQNGRDLIPITEEQINAHVKVVDNLQEESREIIGPTGGWKLHLNFDSNNQKTVAEITAKLQQLEDSSSITGFKIGRSGQDGKEATVYVGARADAEKIATLISNDLSAHLLPPEGEVLKDDIPVAGYVYGRFDVQQDKTFRQYGSKGVPYIDYPSELRFQNLTPDQKREQAHQLLVQRYGKFYTG